MPHGLISREALPVFINTRFFTEMMTIPLFLGDTAVWRTLQLHRAKLAVIHARFGCKRRDIHPEARLAVRDMFPTEDTIDWDAYLHLMENPPDDPFSSLGHRAASFNSLFLNRLAKESEEMAQECLVGMLMVQLDRLSVMQKMKTEGYALISRRVVWLLDVMEKQAREIGVTSMDVALVSRWPVWAMLLTFWQGATLRRVPYALDFHPWEILRPDRWGGLTDLRALPAAAHDAALEARLREIPSPPPSRTFQVLVAALRDCLKAEPLPGFPSHSKLVLFTLAWGGRLAKYVGGVLRRIIITTTITITITITITYMCIHYIYIYIDIDIDIDINISNNANDK